MDRFIFYVYVWYIDLFVYLCQSINQLNLYHNGKIKNIYLSQITFIC